MSVSRFGRIGLIGVLASILHVTRADAAVPYTPYCYYVVQAGPVDAPIEGERATRYLRACPNNDGGSSLPNHVRIKVVVRHAAGYPIPWIAAADVGALLNGGTPEQGFSGVGADSIVSNSQFNPMCPELRWITSDSGTDADGIAYITLAGASASEPGVAVRDPARKWGHYDSKIPIFVVGFEMSGRLTSEAPNGSYTLQIKNFDHTGGLGTEMNQGEAVTSADFNAIANNIGVSNALTWWRDFDNSGGIASSDFNLIATHVTHDCDTPNEQ